MKWAMVLVLFLCGCDRVREMAEPKTAAKKEELLPRWEYKTLTMDSLDWSKQNRRMEQGSSDAPKTALIYFINGKECRFFSAALHFMGTDGWEYMGTVPFESGADLVFKRPAGNWPETTIEYKERTRFDK